MEAFLTAAGPARAGGQTYRPSCPRTKMRVAHMEKLAEFGQKVRDFFGVDEKVDFHETITSNDIDSTDQGDLIILTTLVTAKEGEGEKMARKLKTLQLKTMENEVPTLCKTITVTTDPEDPCVFQIVEVLKGIGAMAAHQKSAHYQEFVRDVQPMLKNSLGIHLCRVRNGVISASLYPYGPSGEGGRDDMVYSGNRK